MYATSSNRRGFTLLEILIALVLFAILATALYASYFTVIRARDRSAEGMEARRELGGTLDLLRREIASATFSRNDKLKRTRFVVEDRDSFGKPASNLELTTLAPPSDQARKESGVSAVQYRMLEKNGRLVLTRREQDLLLEAVDIPFYPQMERISSFLVECHDGSKWVKSWDTTLNNSLPKMVRITVQVLDDGKPAEFTVYATPRIIVP